MTWVEPARQEILDGDIDTGVPERLASFHQQNQARMRDPSSSAELEAK